MQILSAWISNRVVCNSRGEMKVYLAKVGEYYESSFWEGVFFDKKKAYREAGVCQKQLHSR